MLDARQERKGLTIRGMESRRSETEKYTKKLPPTCVSPCLLWLALYLAGEYFFVYHPSHENHSVASWCVDVGFDVVRL